MKHEKCMQPQKINKSISKTSYLLSSCATGQSNTMLKSAV